MNPILSDKKNFADFSQHPHIKSFEDVSFNFQVPQYGCLSKISAMFNGKQVLREVKKVLQCHFSDLYERLNALTDTRERKCYSPAESVLGGMVLFLLKKKSRNEMDNDFRELEFSKNYHKIFKLRCPSMCAVEDFYRMVPTEEFDRLKVSMLAVLIEKRTLHSHRLLGKYFTISVDGTGVYASQTKHWDECTFQTSKHGVVTWMNHVLEAKLVCSNGLSLSLCSEWITNRQEFDKQDYELKAFKRLAPRLKVTTQVSKKIKNPSLFQYSQKYFVFIVIFSTFVVWKKWSPYRVRNTNNCVAKMKFFVAKSYNFAVWFNSWNRLFLC